MLGRRLREQPAEPLAVQAGRKASGRHACPARHQGFARRAQRRPEEGEGRMTNTSNGTTMTEHRRFGAEHRAAKRAERSPSAQIAALDERLGEGVGARKERARLAGKAAATGKAKASRQ